MSPHHDASTGRDARTIRARLVLSWRTLWASPRKELLLDLIERTLVIALFCVFASRMLSKLTTLVLIQIEHPEVILEAASANIGAILLVVSEALGVFLIIIRHTSPTLSTRKLDWVLTFVAVNAPFLVVPAPPSTFIPTAVASSVMFAGLLIQISAKATLWRSFGVLPANRGVRTGGPYRFVRHPMYAGYTITHIGFALGFPSLQNAALLFAAFLVEVARLMREEAILNQDPAYRAYAARVRFRLLPGVF